MVNIIVPFYNNESSLEQTLASVEAQTFSNWSVILIDDCSTDSSPSIAKRFLQRNTGKGKLIRSLKARSGPALGRNQALQNADSLYVVCLDSDDLLAPFCLEQRVSVMQKNPELDWAVFNQYQVAPGDKEPYPIFNFPVKTRDEAIAYFLRMETAWQTMAPIWKTEALNKLGGFDETLYPSEDPDLHLRALLTKDLNMAIFPDLPADCYYFVADKSDDKIVDFWSDSIKSKLKFVKKTIGYLPDFVSSKTLKKYKCYLGLGYYKFVTTFLLSRFKDHRKQFREVTLLLIKSHALSFKHQILIKILFYIFTSDSLVIKKFRIRGLLHKLLIRK